MSTAEDESAAAQVLKEMMEKLDAVKQGQISYPQITLAPDVSSPLFNWQDQDPVPPNTTAPGSAPHLPPTTPPVVTSPQIGQPTSSSATADRPVSSTSEFPVSMYGIPVNNPTESQVTPTPPAANPSQSVLPPTDPKGIAFDFFGQPRDPDPTYKKTPSRGNKGEFETMVLNMSSEKGVMLDHLHIQNMWTLNCASPTDWGQSEVSIYLSAVLLANQLSAANKLEGIVNTLTQTVERLNVQFASEREISKQLLDRFNNLSVLVSREIAALRSLISKESAETRKSINAHVESLGKALMVAPTHHGASTSQSAPQKAPEQEAPNPQGSGGIRRMSLRCNWQTSMLIFQWRTTMQLAR
ncbi:hypothetical protein PS2_001622 [Malus domestica]